MDQHAELHWHMAEPCGCRLGWLPPDDEGRPRPCPRCKPHLIRKADTDGTTRWNVDRTQLKDARKPQWQVPR